MPTVQQIIDWVDRYYPNQETDANKIIDLEQLHSAIYEQLVRKKNLTTTFTDYTIADQYTYTFYSDCKPENVVKIEVSSDTTTNIDDDTTWQEYEYADINKDVASGFYWTKLTDTTYILVKDALAIDTSDYEIRVTYFASPTAITTVSQTPDLDDIYHDLLKYGLIQMLASEGDNPDTEVANYYQNKYDERLKQIYESLKEHQESSPVEAQIWGSRW